MTCVNSYKFFIAETAGYNGPSKVVNAKLNATNNDGTFR